VIRFRYDDPDCLRDAFREAAGDVAGVFATPFRHDVFADQSLPSQEFAETARRLSDEAGALLIVDEIRTGLRLARDCGWAALGIAPDVSCWGKSIANGYPISAVLGSDKARAAFGKIFATGTFWFSAVPMAAALATLHEVRTTDYLERIVASGTMLRQGLAEQAARHGFGLRQTGPVQLPQILFADDPDFRLGYGFAAEAVSRGVYLHPFHNNFVSAALTEADVRQTLEITDAAFSALKVRGPGLGPVPQLAGRFPTAARTAQAERAHA
jgi:glutamate-1-semialdehyde 2,1-aminomutase